MRRDEMKAIRAITKGDNCSFASLKYTLEMAP